MAGLYVVPDALHAALHSRLDDEIAKCPDAEKDREFLYGQLLEAFAQYGTIPEFTLVPSDSGEGDAT